MFLSQQHRRMSRTSSAVWLISGVINVFADVENSFKYTESVNIMMHILGNDIICKKSHKIVYLLAYSRLI